MIWHVLCALVLLFYLEISGQYFLYKLNRNDYPLAFGFGLMFLMAYCYITTSILTNLNCSFYIIAIIYSLYIFVTLILIIKDISKVNWHFDYKNWLLVLLFVGIVLCYSWNTTLGDTSGFDSVYYLNMISTNIKSSELNTTNLYFGGIGQTLFAQYTFQSYYYFVSYFVWIAYRVLSNITEVTYMSLTVWVFQIIYDFFLASIVINGCQKLNNKRVLLKLVSLFIFAFFYGKIYYNSVFGFYGNTYRTIAVSYSIMLLYELYMKNSKEGWILLGTSLLSACAFSSTALFITVFILFASYFTLVDKEKNLFKYYAVILIFPLIDLFATIEIEFNKCAIISVAICLILFIFGKPLRKMYRLKYLKLAILILSFIFMFVMSYKTTGNLLDFSAFFDNGSEQYDMTIDYFSNSTLYGKGETWYRIISLGGLLYACLFENKNGLIKSFLVLIFVVFNPFCCSFLYKINVVYYRAYEIILNPFTFILFIDLLLDRINNKYFYCASVSIIFILFAIGINYTRPQYHHGSFIPEENYNNLMKMNNDEFDVLYALKQDIDYHKEEESPYIVSTNLFTMSVIPNGNYLYSRELRFSDGWSESKKQLYSIFYPSAYLGDEFERVPADYDNISEYLKQEDVDYLVVDKTREYYDPNGYFDYLINKVSASGYGYSIYHNDTYELFKFWD